MKTNNEKWHGKPKSGNPKASRDGKPYEVRNVKNILRGSSIKPSEGRGTQTSSDAESEIYKRPRFLNQSKGLNEKPQREVDGNRWESPNNGSARNRFSQQRQYSSSQVWGDKYDENGEKIYGRTNYQNTPDGRQKRLSFRKSSEISHPRSFEASQGEGRKNVTFRKPRKSYDSNYDPNAKYSQKKQFEFRKNTVDLTKPVRLNKFLANAGICSRREADEYIQAGIISVNGTIVSQLGAKVLPTDKVLFHDQAVHSERKVYILLNKPKDCVTTSEDTHARLTVLDVVKNACSERVYPVGRLDRNTTGVLLLTNDGDLASKLTHPKYDKKKIYHVVLDKPLEDNDLRIISKGVMLEEENIAIDAIEYVKPEDKRQIGIEIHSGQNRVVRRIFDKFGYKVIRLDRVYFAGLTKKNLPRGKYRFLNEREINMLKMGAHE